MDEIIDYQTPDKIEEYNKAIEYLRLAESHMSKALSGKNRKGILTDISNTSYRIKREYLNKDY